MSNVFPLRPRWRRAAVATLTALLTFTVLQAAAEDIEIFTNDEVSLVGRPNVLIVLDNSANWSRQSQQWPGGLTQGQSEARAIKNVINGLEENSINIGLMEYSTDGNATTNEGGYLRYHIRPLTSQTKTEISSHLDTIFNNINAPIEKRSSGNGFGTLFWDVYNYLSELNQSQNGSGTPASRADTAAYVTNFSKFRSPLNIGSLCGRTIVIFIGNNVQSGPSKDADSAINALKLAGGNIAEIPFADFEIKETPVEVNRGFTASCYDSAANCTTAENGLSCTEQGFDSCYCDAASAQACLLQHFSVIGTKSVTTVVSDTTEVTDGLINTGEAGITCGNPVKVGTYSCPGTGVTTQDNSPAFGQTTRVTTTWDLCQYTDLNGTGCNGNKRNYAAQGRRTTRTIVEETQSTSEGIGFSNSCSSSAATCTTSDITSCTDGSYTSCVCSASSSTTSGCPTGATSSYNVIGRTVRSEATPTNSFSTPTGGPWIADEWTRFLSQVGVRVPGGDATDRAVVSTYTLDVFNAQQNPNFSALLFNMARTGGGKYYQAKSEDQISIALTDIFGEIQAVNSAFASASLPVNSTNRAQSENQVYIGLFKPDRLKKPRWFGNLKRYQLILDQDFVTELGDSNGKNAINNETGFISDCAASYWTKDSGNYWEKVISDDPDAASGCPTATDIHSDYPDGPAVEKGGAAQILRNANSATATPDADGNYPVVRNMYTLSGSSVVSLSGLSDTLLKYTKGADNGLDPANEDGDTFTVSETRASIHGDVIHSRPQAVNFGGSTGVVIYYGANDGAYRAVRGDTGEEVWSFVAPEHFAFLPRLQANTPKVNLSGGLNGKPYFFDGSTGLLQNGDSSQVYIYPSQRRGGRKVYGFDVSKPLVPPSFLGSKGCPLQGTDIGCDTGFEKMGQSWSRPSVIPVKVGNAQVQYLVYGGGYDVCEDANTSTPACTSSKGAGVYVTDAKLGGLIAYFDFTDPAINADGTERGVAADLAFSDANGDGYVDYIYAATTGGAIYRINFSNPALGHTPLDSVAAWSAKKIAETTGGGRKFLFSPFVVPTKKSTYIGIGSGDREHPLASHYPSIEGIVNRFYVFRDEYSAGVLDLDDATAMANYTVDPGCDPTTEILPGSTKRGWFVDLTANGPGEQVVTAPVVVGGQVFFSTNRPTPPDPNSCSSSLGDARGYILDMLNGSGAINVDGSCGGDRSTSFESGGLPPSPVIARVPITDSEGNEQEKTVVIGGAEKDGTRSSIVGAQDIEPDISSARRPISWSRDLDVD